MKKGNVSGSVGIINVVRKFYNFNSNACMAMECVLKPTVILKAVTTYIPIL